MPAPASGAKTAIVTRPAGQVQPWLDALALQGQAAVALPLLAIHAAPDQSPLQQAWQRLTTSAHGFQVVMFVSANAVAHFFHAGQVAAVSSRAPGAPASVCLPWPQQTLAAATGPGTVAALQDAGVPPQCIVAPEPDSVQFDSETLWPLLQARLQQEQHRPPRALSGRSAGAPQSLLLVRGQEGRNWLQAQWQAQGGEVSTVVAYHRARPQWRAEELALACQALDQPQRFVWLLSSSEAVAQLPALAQAAARAGLAWRRCLALATHPRIAQAAQGLGFAHVPVVAPSPQLVAAALRRAVAWLNP